MVLPFLPNINIIILYYIYFQFLLLSINSLYFLNINKIFKEIEFWFLIKILRHLWECFLHSSTHCAKLKCFHFDLFTLRWCSGSLLMPRFWFWFWLPYTHLFTSTHSFMVRVCVCVSEESHWVFSSFATSLQLVAHRLWFAAFNRRTSNASLCLCGCGCGSRCKWFLWIALL